MNLADIAALLRRFDPTDEEATAADVLDAIDTEHQRVDDHCYPCAETWPCARRIQGEQLAVRALGWATDRRLGRVEARPATTGELPRPVPLSALGPSEDELARYRYPPDGDVDRWVRDGPPGHINHPGSIEETA